jgi:hypothetical protein
MHKARAFFLVCCGILALTVWACAKEPTAPTPTSIASQRLQGVGISREGGRTYYSASDAGRVLWVFAGGGLQKATPLPIPGTSPVMATHVYPIVGMTLNFGASVVLANGDCWSSFGEYSEWSWTGNLLGNPRPDSSLSVAK